MSDKLREGRTKVFCPKCEEVYIPNKKTELDGGVFRTFNSTHVPKIVLIVNRASS